MDVHFQSGQDVDVNWFFGPKMDVHRTFCAIWVNIVHINLTKYMTYRNIFERTILILNFNLD